MFLLWIGMETVFYWPLIAFYRIFCQETSRFSANYGFFPLKKLFVSGIDSLNNVKPLQKTNFNSNQEIQFNSVLLFCPGIDRFITKHFPNN